MSGNQYQPKRKSIFSLFLSVFQVVLTITLVGTSGYFYYQYQKISKNPLAAQITAQEEAKSVAVLAGKLMLLPKNEVPTIATVTDIAKLKDQDFFKNAKNGNKVLIYPNSKLAIIYDQKQNLIINVGPVNFSAPSSDQTQATPKTRIGLRNGTKIVGITRSVESALISAFPDTTVTLRDQDKKTDYSNTTVVDLNGSMGGIAEELASALNARVGPLPAGETKPTEVDILIIVGTDKS